MVPSGFLIMVLTVSTALIGSDSQGSMWDSRLINREGQDLEVILRVTVFVGVGMGLFYFYSHILH